jgi:hypothetical protein
LKCFLILLGYQAASMRRQCTARERYSRVTPEELFATLVTNERLKRLPDGNFRLIA